MGGRKGAEWGAEKGQNGNIEKAPRKASVRNPPQVREKPQKFKKRDPD